MKKKIFILSFLSIFLSIQINKNLNISFAQTTTPETIEQEPENEINYKYENNNEDDVNSVIGEVKAPPGVRNFNGLGDFISVAVQIFSVIAGIFMFWNIISAGWLYLTNSENSSVASKVSQKIINSVMGMAVIVAAYTLTAVVSFILFRDPGYILNLSFKSVKDQQNSQEQSNDLKEKYGDNYQEDYEYIDEFEP